MSIPRSLILAAGALSLGLAVSACSGRQHPVGIFAPSAAAVRDRFSTRVDAARRQFDDGLYDQARKSVESLLADGATHPMVPLLRARIAEVDGDWPACIAWSRKAVEASPSWGEPRVLLARACLEAKRIDEADAAFVDVDRLLPDEPWGPYGRAWVAAQRLNLVRAAEFGDEALRRDPDHRPALMLRAEIARLAGDPVTEERCLRRCDALGDSDAEVVARLGELAEAAGRTIDAVRCYERAWDLHPTREVARRRLALARLAGDGAATSLWAERAGQP